jgi:hypothetical protein
VLRANNVPIERFCEEKGEKFFPVISTSFMKVSPKAGHHGRIMGMNAYISIFGLS